MKKLKGININVLIEVSEQISEYTVQSVLSVKDSFKKDMKDSKELKRRVLQAVRSVKDKAIEEFNDMISVEEDEMINEEETLLEKK